VFGRQHKGEIHKGDEKRREEREKGRDRVRKRGREGGREGEEERDDKPSHPQKTFPKHSSRELFSAWMKSLNTCIKEQNGHVHIGAF
jgi:hypothetical protein